MAPRASTRFTYPDLLALPDDGRRHEIIGSEHVVTPAPRTRHQAVSMALSVLIGTYVRERGGVILFAAPVDVLFSNEDVVEPDLVLVLAEHADRITDKNIQGPPDLAVEILSEGTRKTDEVAKKKLYERSGVPEYWIVDPDLETVKVYRREGEGYGRPMLLSKDAGDVLASPLLPGLSVALAAVFA